MSYGGEWQCEKCKAWLPAYASRVHRGARGTHQAAPGTWCRPCVNAGGVRVVNDRLVFS